MSRKRRCCFYMIEERAEEQWEKCRREVWFSSCVFLLSMSLWDGGHWRQPVVQVDEPAGHWARQSEEPLSWVSSLGQPWFFSSPLVTASDSACDLERCILLFWVPQHCWCTGESTDGIERNRVKCLFSPIVWLLALNKLHLLLVLCSIGSHMRGFTVTRHCSVWKFITANFIPILVCFLMT